LSMMTSQWRSIGGTRGQIKDVFYLGIKAVC
jgi:hypothetical protein